MGTLELLTYTNHEANGGFNHPTAPLPSSSAVAAMSTNVFSNMWNSTDACHIRENAVIWASILSLSTHRKLPLIESKAQNVRWRLSSEKGQSFIPPLASRISARMWGIPLLPYGEGDIQYASRERPRHVIHDVRHFGLDSSPICGVGMTEVISTVSVLNRSNLL